MAILPREFSDPACDINLVVWRQNDYPYYYQVRKGVDEAWHNTSHANERASRRPMCSMGRRSHTCRREWGRISYVTGQTIDSEVSAV